MESDVTPMARMSRARACEVLVKLDIHSVKSDAHGIEIHRVLGDGIERWRLQTGGGIAGNSDQIWLSAIVRAHGMPRGPYTTKGTLEKALRAWRRSK